MQYDPDMLLDSWEYLNNVISSIRDEDFCLELLKRELSERKRGSVAFRLHSRFNKLRANRERLELTRICGDTAAHKIASYPELRYALENA